jgi:hypothetical protein
MDFAKKFTGVASSETPGYTLMDCIVDMVPLSSSLLSVPSSLLSVPSPEIVDAHESSKTDKTTDISTAPTLLALQALVEPMGLALDVKDILEKLDTHQKRLAVAVNRLAWVDRATEAAAAASAAQSVVAEGTPAPGATPAPPAKPVAQPVPEAARIHAACVKEAAAVHIELCQTLQQDIQQQARLLLEHLSCPVASDDEINKVVTSLQGLVRAACEAKDARVVHRAPAAASVHVASVLMAK